jgi:putative transposase
MARLSRITVPDLPHHVTQRGNRRQEVFSEDGDYALYRDLLAERCAANQVVCAAYCLMPNHVHLVLIPKTAEGLSRAVGETHRRFSAYVNARARVTGHVFQGRFHSAAMDEPHFLNAIRYLAFNPVQAGLANRPAAWPWSSVSAHVRGKDDALVKVAPVLELVADVKDLFKRQRDVEPEAFALETKSMIGRPLGDAAFLASVATRLGRDVAAQKRGRKKRSETGRG